MYGPELSKIMCSGHIFCQSVWTVEMLPVLLQSVPANIKARMWFQHDKRLHISAQMCKVHWIQQIQDDGLDGFVR
ncbi:hypothetical protein TNCV_1014451 [Trichonephila clavipes]|uniref:Uncharacterized protein n=1 Tax=Trichonephila clavipes TaxID=2585209 RepID=A0A8X6VXI4_TRICX|nr:hypothetical protein TNCV_1014451 [Trichonephila clavipes]